MPTTSNVASPLANEKKSKLTWENFVKFLDGEKSWDVIFDILFDGHIGWNILVILFWVVVGLLVVDGFFFHWALLGVCLVFFSGGSKDKDKKDPFDRGSGFGGGSSGGSSGGFGGGSGGGGGAGRDW